MRYENWDVLLFPEGSKVPLQEFKTQCFAARDLDSPYLHNQLLDNPASFYQSVNAHGGPGQLPVLTTFIPSMNKGSPFRVSIHSWDKPAPTRVMEGLMQPEDSVMYEVRVFIDGYCISGSLFNNRAPWPHVIDFSSQMDKNGNQDLLRFPPFHEEILRHVRWDATEVYGRIRVIIAEGFTRPHRSPPFERVRDIIAFSFQHAPLPILEQSNIAWPNPGMWQQGPRPFPKQATDYEASYAKDEEAHSHSPIRHGVQRIGTQDSMPAPSYSMWPYRLYPTLSFPRQATPWPERGTGWAPTPLTSDPFVEAFRAPPVQNRRNRSTLSDVPMPDYVASTSTSSRAISGNTGSSLGRNKEPEAPAPIDDEQYNQLIEALSPKKPTSGTSAPANTPTTTLPAAKKSPENQSRAVSYPRKESRPGPLRELSQASSKGPSNPSLESRGSEDNSPPPVVLLTPSGHITGRKERRSSKGNSSGGASVSSKPPSGKKKSASPVGQQENPKSSESKRKRRMSSMDASVASAGSMGASPTKKISRRMDEGNEGRDMIEALLEATSAVVTGESDLQDE